MEKQIKEEVIKEKIKEEPIKVKEILEECFDGEYLKVRMKNNSIRIIKKELVK